jgi:GDPmannose 4,6-dehydratase
MDSHLLRPAEVNTLCGDASLARSKLGWTPKMSFAELVATMVDADLKRVSQAIAAEKAVPRGKAQG